jgi:hypothetical protein
MEIQVKKHYKHFKIVKIDLFACLIIKINIRIINVQNRKPSKNLNNQLKQLTLFFLLKIEECYKIKTYNIKFFNSFLLKIARVSIFAFC